MVPLRLQIILIVVSTMVFYLILKNIKKQKMTTDLGTIWILWGLGLIVISIFPDLMAFIANVMGIESSIHAIYLIMIFLLYVLLFNIYLKHAVLEEKVKNIIQLLALDKKDKDEK